MVRQLIFGGFGAKLGVWNRVGSERGVWTDVNGVLSDMAEVRDPGGTEMVFFGPSTGVGCCACAAVPCDRSTCSHGLDMPIIVTLPSFIIPKTDPTALPRWVNNYRKLNNVTVPDNYPLPHIDDILADCSQGKSLGQD
jgi:hypothetical protein